MRICVRCGHSNAELASQCENCEGMLTLQLQVGKKKAMGLSTIPEIPIPPEVARGRIRHKEPSKTINTRDFEDRDMIPFESLSAGELLSVDPKIDSVMFPVSNQHPKMAPASSEVEKKSEQRGFSLSNSSFDGVDSVHLADQIQLHTIKDPLIDQKVGDFQFVEKIGKGGFGAVYRAERLSHRESVAIKVLHLHQVDNPEVVRRFQREARALAQLEHPGIVGMIDFGMLPEHGFYLVMDFLKGQTLYEKLRAREDFSIHRLIPIFRQLCEVLSFVHQKGIVHRDLKLSNIHISLEPGNPDKVTLLDFGIAAVTDDVDSITKTGAYIGTATYASPEQAQGVKDLDGRSDLYALAVLLYRLLVGRPPFQGTNSMEITHRKILEPAPSMSALAPHQRWSTKLEAFMKSALARNADERPVDAMSFWSWCEEGLNDQILIEKEGVIELVEEESLSDPKAAVRPAPPQSEPILLHTPEHQPKSSLHTLDPADDIDLAMNPSMMLATSKTVEWNGPEEVIQAIAEVDMRAAESRAEWRASSEDFKAQSSPFEPQADFGAGERPVSNVGVEQRSISIVDDAEVDLSATLDEGIFLRTNQSSEQSPQNTEKSSLKEQESFAQTQAELPIPATESIAVYKESISQNDYDDDGESTIPIYVHGSSQQIDTSNVQALVQSMEKEEDRSDEVIFSTHHFIGRETVGCDTLVSAPSSKELSELKTLSELRDSNKEPPVQPILSEMAGKMFAIVLLLVCGFLLLWYALSYLGWLH